MSKASSCYLHIGAPKTGTTALQKLLCDNRAALAAAGILYPTSSLRGYGHHDIAYLLADGYPDYATTQPLTLDEIATLLASEVRQHSGSIVLSSENFYLFPRPRETYAFLERTGCLRGRRCSIIVYVRRQDDAHESWYNQTIKAQGFTHDLATCMEASYDLWDYDRRLAEWADVFGPEALVVRPYEAEGFAEGSLSKDFFSLIDSQIVHVSEKEERVNSGLNRDILEFQRIINGLPMSIVEKRRFHRQLIDLSERSQGLNLFSEEPVMSDDVRCRLLEGYSAGNARVARTYLGSDRLFVRDAPRDSHAARSEPPRLTVEKLCLLFGWLMSRER